MYVCISSLTKKLQNVAIEFDQAVCCHRERMSALHDCIQQLVHSTNGLHKFRRASFNSFCPLPFRLQSTFLVVLSVSVGVFGIYAFSLDSFFSVFVFRPHNCNHTVEMHSAHSKRLDVYGKQDVKQSTE